ncbi:hypothetical protein CR205_14160 [Alteribacter lacisalsi]|uniref:Uncharacterized protein n=1 Tax=Alteribacter lacisalsi TaxID=2045244 RepID=A0A2W0H9T0_9BACI|nr:hypothetical protein [Alteribacter lacisalsi]PYZ96820.1 hypothetical protein CR205_14160 [Alteribacter lacisalsi]
MKSKQRKKMAWMLAFLILFQPIGMAFMGMAAPGVHVFAEEADDEDEERKSPRPGVSNADDRSGGSPGNPGSPGNGGGGSAPAPGNGGSNPGGGDTNPGDGGSNPGGGETNPGDDGSNPGGDGTNPGDGTSPGDDGSNPGGDGTSPGDDDSSPGGDGTNPGNDGSNPGEGGSGSEGTGTSPREGGSGSDGSNSGGEGRNGEDSSRSSGDGNGEPGSQTGSSPGSDGDGSRESSETGGNGLVNGDVVETLFSTTDDALKLDQSRREHGNFTRSADARLALLGYLNLFDDPVLQDMYGQMLTETGNVIDSFNHMAILAARTQGETEFVRAYNEYLLKESQYSLTAAKVADSTRSTGSRITQFTRGLADQISNTVTGMAAKVDHSVQQAARFVEGVQGRILHHTQNMYEAGKGSLNALRTAMSMETVQNSAAWSFVTKAAEKGASSFHATRTAVTNIIDGATAYTANSLNNFNLTAMVGSAGQTISNAAGSVADAGKNLFQTINNSKPVSWMKTFANTPIGKATGGALNAFAIFDGAANAMDSSNSGWERTGHGLNAVSGALGLAATGVFIFAGATVAAPILAIGATVVGLAAFGILYGPKIAEGAKKAWNWTTDQFSSFTSDPAGYASDVGNKVKDGISNAFDSGKNFVSGLFGS